VNIRVFSAAEPVPISSFFLTSVVCPLISGFWKRLIAQAGELVKQRGLLVKAHYVRSGRKSIANLGYEMWDVGCGKNQESGVRREQRLV
jgi:hypothetical protein